MCVIFLPLYNFVSFNKGIRGYFVIVFITLFYLQDFTSGFMSHDHLDNQFVHTWSLGVEEQFYLLWAPLYKLLLLHKKNTVLTLFILIITSLSFLFITSKGIEGNNLAYFQPESRSNELFIGCLISVLLEKFQIKNYFFIKIFLATGCTGLLIIDLYSTRFGILNGFAPQQLSAAISSAILIYGIVNSNGQGLLLRILDSRPFTYIGKRSYGIYLFSYPILRLLIKEFRQLGILKNGISTSYLLIAILIFAITFVTASLSYKFVEQPLLKLKI